MLQKSIKWFFNPARAWHHGGVWERLITSTRKVLGALIKEQSLDDESLKTLLCKCESIINGKQTESGQKELRKRRFKQPMRAKIITDVSIHILFNFIEVIRPKCNVDMQFSERNS